MENILFNDLEISKELKRAIRHMGFEEATPIQSQSIVPILEGKDVIAQAPTGTGKTCAFGIWRRKRYGGLSSALPESW